MGLLFTLVFGNLAFASWQEARRLPQSPQPVSLAEAAAAAPLSYDERPWVTIVDGAWDCGSIRYQKVGDDERTQLILTDDSKAVVLVVEFPNRLTCDELSSDRPSGLLSRMSETRASRFQELFEGSLAGYHNPSVLMDLCAFCGLGNSRLGIVLGSVLALLGLSFYPMFWYLHSKKDRSEL